MPKEDRSRHLQTLTGYLLLGRFLLVLPILISLIALCLVGLVIRQSEHIPTIWLFFIITVCFVGIAWTWLGALPIWRLTHSPSRGIALNLAQAKDFKQALHDLAQQLETWPIAHVIINDTYAVTCSFNKKELVLNLGLPLLCGMDSQRVLALIAQAMAFWQRNVKSNHQQLLLWRQRLEFCLRKKNAQAFSHHGFLPRLILWFSPKVLILAKHWHYQRILLADQHAATLVGFQTLAYAIAEQYVRNDIMYSHVWQHFWLFATRERDPQRLPFDWLRQGLAEKLFIKHFDRHIQALNSQPIKKTAVVQMPSQYASRWSLALDEEIVNEKTRLHALECNLQNISISQRSSLSILSTQGHDIIRKMDADWWNIFRNEWFEIHDKGVRDAQQMAQLQSRASQMTAQELLQLGALMARVKGNAYALPIYRAALLKAPALDRAQWLLAKSECESNNFDAFELLYQLTLQFPHYGYKASVEALALVERLPISVQTALQKQRWQPLLERFTQMERRAQQKITPLAKALKNLQHHQLQPYEIDDITAGARQAPQIRTIWAGKIPVSLFPQRHHFLLVIEHHKGVIANEQQIQGFAQLLPSLEWVQIVDKRALDKEKNKQALRILDKPIYKA